MMYLKAWVVDNEVTTVQTSDMEIDWLAIEPTTDALIFDAEMDCDYCDASEIIPLVKFDGKQLTGLDFKSQSFIEWKAPIIPPEQLDAQARAKRKQLLETIVDPVVSNPLRWNDLTADQQQAYKDYRQALLDITDQDGYPENIEWPTLGV